MKKKIFISSVCFVVFLAFSIGTWIFYHPTYYRFNDRIIIGNTEEKIIEKYGAFSKSSCNDEGEIIYGTYMIRDNTPELIMSNDNSLWYEIYFQDGIAVSIKLQDGRRGG